MPSNKGRTKFCLVILAFAIMTRFSFCQTYLTNEQLLVTAAANSGGALLDSLKLSPGEMFIPSTNDLDNLPGEGLKSAFIKAGWQLFSSTDSSKQGHTIATAHLSAFQFGYHKGNSRGFLKKPFIKRLLKGQLLITINGPLANYIGFREINYEDQIPFDQANIVASPKYNQLAPQTPALGSSRYLEPLAVGATVGGLIYLFFASR